MDNGCLLHLRTQPLKFGIQGRTCGCILTSAQYHPIMQGGHILPGGIQVGFPVQYCGVASEPGIFSFEALHQSLLHLLFQGEIISGDQAGNLKVWDLAASKNTISLVSALYFNQMRHLLLQMR